MKTRICVIGGGSSGLSVLRALQSLDESQYEFVCYERYETVGGLWNFKGHEGIEDDGMPVHSSMYYNLTTNGPKQIFEHPEFLFPLDDESEEGKTMYPGVDYIFRYIKKFMEHYDLEKYIKFKTWVQNVTFNDETEKFKVIVKDLNTFTETEEVFDYVIVSTGQFNYPNLVSYPGQETFKGQILHSKHFMDASRFKGKRVLVVGGSFSAEDIVLHCYLAGAEYITVSYRTRPIHANLPAEIIQRPIISKIDGYTVSFSDGTEFEYDAIIYCTGYLRSFPFLEEKLRVTARSQFSIPLYKQIVLPSNHKMFFIAMHGSLYPWGLSWVQGHFVAQVISGKLSVPSDEEIQKDIEVTETAEKSVRSFFDIAAFMSKYTRDLAAITGKPSVDGTVLIDQLYADRTADLLNHKKETHFKSLYRDENGVPSSGQPLFIQ